MFATAYEAGGPWNESQWDDPRFQELLFAGRTELDSAKRRTIYREMQEILSNRGGTVIPMYANYVDAASSSLAHGENLGNNFQLDGSRLAERWWFS